MEKFSIKKTILLFVILTLSAMVFIAGCGSSAEAPAAQAPAQPVAAQVLVDPEPPEAPEEVEEETTEEVEIEREDTKTEPEKVVEVVELALADGTYVENVGYRSPGGNDEVELTLTVANDIITDIQVKHVKGGSISRGHMERMAAELPSLAEGKKIDELELPDRISTSSLTTAAVKNKIQELIDEF